MEIKARHPERILIKKIKAGLIPNVEITDRYEKRYEVEDNEGRIVFSRMFRLETIKGKSLTDIIERHKHQSKIFLLPASTNFPYFEGPVMYDPCDFQPKKTYLLRICMIPLNGAMREFEWKKHDKAMEEYKKACEFEEQFIDDTDYDELNRYYRLLTLKNN